MTIVPGRYHSMQRWGLKIPVQGNRRMVSNARSETLLHKVSFRSLQRCAFVADGWFEWQHSPGGKQPWYHHGGGRLLYFAGVYEPENGCVIVTEPAADSLRHIHCRQPVWLDEVDLEPWLTQGAAPKRSQSLTMTCHPVAKTVSDARIDEPGLIKPLPRDRSDTRQTADCRSVC
jgi:putative SOS response-associated peptidase YedK